MILKKGAIKRMKKLTVGCESIKYYCTLYYDKSNMTRHTLVNFPFKERMTNNTTKL